MWLMFLLVYGLMIVTSCSHGEDLIPDRQSALMINTDLVNNYVDQSIRLILQDHSIYINTLNDMRGIWKRLFQAVMKHNEYCIFGSKIIAGKLTVLTSRDFCRHMIFRYDGLQSSEAVRLEWIIRVREDHMINITVDRGYTPLSFHCQQGRLRLTSLDKQSVYCGHTLLQVIYFNHHMAQIILNTDQVSNVHLDVKYQVHAKNYALSVHENYTMLLRGINFTYTPSYIMVERLNILYVWYFNVNITSFETHYEFSKFTILHFECIGGSSKLSMEEGLLPLIWMKESKNIVQCNKSTTPLSRYYFKHMSLLLKSLYQSQLYIKLELILSRYSRKSIVSYMIKPDTQPSVYNVPSWYNGILYFHGNYCSIHLKIRYIKYTGPVYNMDMSLLVNHVLSSSSGTKHKTKITNLKGKVCFGTSLVA